jgi:hypothetical protein
MSFVSRIRVSSESRSVHVAAFASIAIAQPLFDLLGGAPEFLLAHDLGPSEIMALVAVIGAGVPLACAVFIAALEYVHVRLAYGVATIMVSLFTMLVALYAVKNAPAPPPALIAISAGAGVAGGALYSRTMAARVFAAWLSVGIVVTPILFVVRPGVRSLVWPREQPLAESSHSATPVVLVVFDGLPLSALLDEHQRIDRDLYPSFAALAGESTWYRNATTVADYTQWAVPAILSGRYPTPRSLPIASHHPETIFTLLGSSHRVKVHEPISRLCPESVCDHGDEGVTDEILDFGGTLATAYLHGIVPEVLRTNLPPIDQGWAEGIPPSDNPGEVWLRAGDHSRRGEALTFINSIDEADAPEPSLHVMHVLLPHTPLAYLPGGERYGTERHLPGLAEGRRDRWENDAWAVTQGYRRYLLQIGAVDALVGQLVRRLKDVGLYDRTLLVVTSDHGASFRPGQPFRRVTTETAAEILPVPLLVKKPYQREAVVSDRNVETVDILPTIADIIGVHVPWRLDGISAVGNTPPKTKKTIYYDAARHVRTFPSMLMDDVRGVVDRKVRLFGTHGNVYRVPRNSPYLGLLGRPVDDLTVADALDEIEFAVDLHGDFSHIEPGSRFFPAHMAGRARWLKRDEPAVIAVAVNDVIAATTRTYHFEDRGSSNTWSLLMPPDVFHQGENQVEVFVVSGSDEPVLYRTHFTRARPVDLLSNAAAYGLRVSQKGLYEREGRGDGSFRWTDGAVRIVVPREARQPARSLRVNLATAGPVEKALRIRANGCDVFDGTVPTARWSQIFDLRNCDTEQRDTVIELRSSTHVDASDGRELGVAIERIDLLTQSWPPASSQLPESDRRSHIRFKNSAGDRQSVDSTSEIAIAVVNRGGSIWATPRDLGGEHGAVRVGVLWFRKGQTTSPVAAQRMDLPHALVPGDSADVTFRLVPVAADGTRLPAGEYDAWIGMMQEGVDWFYTSGDSVRKLRVIHDARS